ncbi:hypothetical protein N431DRAFT_541800 [Stipitochalara longipes BDJ]|nr:hypothetical protein N431DRAFT_541800 [Stipitochalara longipes BDJ]
MTDPLTSIGSAALVTGIVEVLAKSISKLHKVHNYWREANFTFINLIAQLTALKATLNNLEEWLNTCIDGGRDPHHQLIMDLEVIITCCKMLAHKIDTEVSELYLNADNVLDSESKVKLALRNDTVEKLQKMVDRQTNALTTLLTACNFGASWYTDTLSKISRSFEFDRELFSSRVYEKVLRHSLKDTVDALRRQASPALRMGYLRASTASPEDRLETSNLQSIHRELEKQSKRRRIMGAYRVVVLGDVVCARAFLNETKILHGNGFTTEELQEYKSVIREKIWRIMEIVETILGEAIVNMDDTTREFAQQVRQNLRDGRSGDANFSGIAAKALQEVWASDNFSELRRSALSRILVPKRFIQEIDRITDEDYIPTTTDILNVNDKRTGTREYEFIKGSSMLNVLDLSSRCWSEKEQWIHQIQRGTCIMFFVNLGIYNEMNLENASQNRIRESIELYRSVAESLWCRHSSFILVFLNSGVVQKTRAFNHDCVSSRAGMINLREPCCFIVEAFKTFTPRRAIGPYVHFCKENDYTILRDDMWAEVNEIYLHWRLVESGVI